MHPRCASPLLLPLLLTLACSSSENGTDDSAAASTGAAASTQPDETATTADASASTDEPTSTTTTSTSNEPTTTTADDAGEGDDVSSSAGEPACGAGGVDDCCCFAVEGDAGHGILSIACTAGESTCEGLQATCPGDQVDCPAADLTVVNPEALECALAALEAGTPGSISWSVSSEDGLGGRSVTLFVQGDRSAFFSGYDYKELEYTYTAVDRRTLQDAGFFSDCAAAGEGERFDCVRQAVGERAAETCLDSFSGTAGRR